MSRRRFGITIVVAGALMAVALLAAVLASSDSRSSRHVRFALRPGLPTAFGGKVEETLLRNGREGGSGQEADAEAEGPAQERYSNNALPNATIAFAQTQTAAAAARKVKGHFGKGKKGDWQEIGPFTLNVDTLATQTFNRPTQWSGRVTALAIDSTNCRDHDCRMYVAAAGGGVWRSENALAHDPNWQPISDDIPSNSIGSLLIDPTDSSGRTIYAGTGEESGSSDSEAGIGLYKSTDGGDHWSLVPGSVAVSKDRGIGAIAVDPNNPNHIFIGTDVARHGASNVNGGRFTPPGAPPIGLYESTDGGATFHAALIKPQDVVNPASPNGSDFFRGGVTKIGYDPTDASTLYLTMTDYGLFRSSNNGGSFDQIFTATPDPAGLGIRYEFAATTLAGGATRIYLADGENDNSPDSASRLLRTNNARAASPSWTNLSSNNPADPGYGSFDFCEGQCSYDMWVETPAGRPDEVWLGGSMHYGELPIYSGADISDGRAVVRSTDGGVHWTDMTGDARVDFEDQHPDTRDIAFVPGKPAIAFIGSDGGVIRTSGDFSDASSQCAGRGLSGVDLSNCQQFLSAVPTRLIPLNAGLRTLQFESVSVDPHNPLNDVLGGTQDNATEAFDGSGTWTAIVTGDGGNSGIDVGDSNLRYHTYFSDQGDVNFHGNNPKTWDWFMDPLVFSGEGASFYVPYVADPLVSQTAYVGLNHVWRTQDGGGDHHFLDNHCFTNGGPKGDAIFTGPNSGCGDWLELGIPSLRSTVYGPSRSGSAGSNYLSSIGRTASDPNTLWASTRLGRVFVSKNANASGHTDEVPSPPFCDDGHGNPVSCGTLTRETDVTFTRIDDGDSATPVTPGRFPSDISVDANDPNHAIVSYAGYDAYTPSTPGHVFDVHFNPTTGHATWTNISYDLGDQPITNVAFDSETGDIYASTDFGVDLLADGSTSWIEAGDDLPPVAVYGLTLADGKKHGDRVLYAATHGRGVWRIQLPDVKK